MPKIAGREVRGEFLALQLFVIGTPVTPKQINDHVGRGDYAAKYISFLRGRHGFDFTVQKDGRNVVSYTLVTEPENAADVRAMATAVKAAKRPKQAKAPKAPKAAKVAAPKEPKNVRVSKQTPVKKAARSVLQERADREAESILAEIGLRNGGEVAHGSYSIDPDWDSMDGIDVANFLKP